MQGTGTVVLGVVALLALSAILGATVPASPSRAVQEDPLRAEAGLDQQVSRNASVLLDATESWSPEGALVDYEWTIERPNGTPFAPPCDSSACRLAHFRASALGTYTVTLTIEDEAGGTATDTMYVEAVPQGPFDVTLTPPADASAGSTGNFTARVSAGDASLERLVWNRSGTVLDARNVSGAGGEYRFEAQVYPGSTYRVTAAAAYNRSVTDSWTAPVTGSWSPSGTSSEQYPRIEGPTLLTGQYDSIDAQTGIQEFTGTYRLLSGPLNFSNRGVWTATGPTFGTNYNGLARTKTFDLGPGVSVLTADVDHRTRIIGLNGVEPNNGTEHRELIAGSSPSTTVSVPVVVDPAPEIRDFAAASSNGGITIEYNIVDPYNPPGNLDVSVEGDSVLSEETDNSFAGLGNRRVSVPDGVYGSVSVSVRFTDGRSQSDTATETVDIPPPLSELTREPSAVLSSHEFNSGGTSPVFG